MAGRGPAPGANPNSKPDHARARRNVPNMAQLRVVDAEPADQPALPDGVDWHPRTAEWWSMWGESPLAPEFTANDWSELMDAALIHSGFWSGDTKLAAELRLRVAKFGATPEDRARLRIQFAQADEADAKRPEKRAGGSRREGLRLAE